MQFDFAKMSADRRYELLLSTAVPRPIALVTTQNAAGAINAAPYSLFNIVSHDPPMLMLAALPTLKLVSRTRRAISSRRKSSS